jgi:hypothetical protein
MNHVLRSRILEQECTSHRILKHSRDFHIFLIGCIYSDYYKILTNSIEEIKHLQLQYRYIINNTDSYNYWILLMTGADESISGPLANN